MTHPPADASPPADLARRDAEISFAARSWLMRHNLTIGTEGAQFVIYRLTPGSGCTAIQRADTRADAYEIAFLLASTPRRRSRR